MNVSRRSLTVAAVAIIALGVSIGAARFQGLPPPPPPPRPAALQARDPLAAPVVGTAAISGVVMTDEITSHPIRRATVTISSGAIRGTRTSATDDAGRFLFSSLPAGQYSLNAQKPGYVLTEYGARRPGRGSAPPIPLADGQGLTNVNLKMPRGAVISGTVTDPNGGGVQGIRLVVMEYRMTGGERALVNAPTTGGLSTDDRGAYRIYGLPAGEYLVAAMPNNGSFNGVHAVTPADIQWAQQQVQRSASRFGGPGQTTAIGPASLQPSGSTQSVGYAPVFYPGTADVSGAVAITLKPGEERFGIDVSLQYVPTAKIDGVVLDPGGQPVQRVAQMSMFSPKYPAPLRSQAQIRPTANGAFTATDVAPGDYVITARLSPPPADGTGRGGGNGFVVFPQGPPARGQGPPTPPPEILWAMMNVTVGGQDLTGLTLTLQPGMTMSGHLALDATSPTPPQPPSNTRVSLTPFSTGATPTFQAQGTPAAQVNPDGTFSIPGVVPGKYRFTVTGPGVGRIGGGTTSWLLKTVAVNDRDVTDRPFDVTPDDTRHEVVVTLSDRPAEVSGKLLDAAGHPATSYVVVMFTTDKIFWGLQSRRTLRSPPGAEGQFTFRNLLPGEYYVSAVTDVDASDFADPDFFEQLVSASIKITVTEGEKKVLPDMKLAGS